MHLRLCAVLSLLAFTLSGISQPLFHKVYSDSSALVRNEILHETKDHYISIGYYHTSANIGVHVRKYDKKTGNLVYHDVFYSEKTWLFTAGRTRIYDTGSKLIFAVCDGYIYKLEYDYHHDILVATDSIENPFKKGFYLKDFEILGDSTIYYARIADSIGWVIRKPDKSLEFIYSKAKEPRNSLEHFIRAENGNYIFFGGKSDPTIGVRSISVAEIDLKGNTIWEKTANNGVSFYIEDILQINKNEYFLLASSTGPDPITQNKGFYDILYKFNLKTKEFTRLRSMSEPGYGIGVYSDLEYSVRDSGAYFVCTNAALAGVTRDSFVTGGRIVKIKEDGKPIWTKNYYYLTGRNNNNNINTILPTSDGNYLLGGELIGPWVDGWLVKIDEDGIILPIDTATATTDTDISLQIPEIRVYPNPASHAIIINQGEITDMTYQLIDMTGAVVKSIPLPHAHHHVVWDISEVPSGTYVLTMLQGRKVIGTKQQIIIR